MPLATTFFVTTVWLQRTRLVIEWTIRPSLLSSASVASANREQLLCDVRTVWICFATIASRIHTDMGSA